MGSGNHVKPICIRLLMGRTASWAMTPGTNPAPPVRPLELTPGGLTKEEGDEVELRRPRTLEEDEGRPLTPPLLEAAGVGGKG